MSSLYSRWESNFFAPRNYAGPLVLFPHKLLSKDQCFTGEAHLRHASLRGKRSEKKTPHKNKQNKTKQKKKKKKKKNPNKLTYWITGFPLAPSLTCACHNYTLLVLIFHTIHFYVILSEYFFSVTITSAY